MLGAGGPTLDSVTLEVYEGARVAAEHNCTRPTEGDLWLSAHPKGSLYLYKDGRWGTVCKEGFSRFHTRRNEFPAAKVACRRLGYADGTQHVSARGKEEVPLSKVALATPINLAFANCDGKEGSLLRCGIDRWVYSQTSSDDETPSCTTHDDDVIVECLAHGGGGLPEIREYCGSRSKWYKPDKMLYDKPKSWLGEAATLQDAMDSVLPDDVRARGRARHGHAAARRAGGEWALSAAGGALAVVAALVAAMSAMRGGARERRVGARRTAGRNTGRVELL